MILDSDEDSGRQARRLYRLRKGWRTPRRASPCALRRAPTVLRGTEYKIEHRVVLWSTELRKREGNELLNLGQGWACWRQDQVRSGNRIARLHLNRLQKIEAAVRETGDPEDCIFFESLRMLRKIAGAEIRVGPPQERRRAGLRYRSAVANLRDGLLSRTCRKLW